MGIPEKIHGQIMRILWIALAIFGLGSAPLKAEDDAGMDFFEKKIRPVLSQHCYRCHSTDKKQSGGLALDNRQATRAGGDSGPAVVPGDVQKSILLKALLYNDPELRMPPKGKLPAQVIADFERWIKIGAPDPRDSSKVAKKSGVDIGEGKKFWAFQLPKKQIAPPVKNKAWVHNSIDQFILAKLEAKNLSPIADASRATLLRRAYFALIGLPPSPQEIEDFVKDKSPQAFSRVVDKLLASPHFGERWARHWLDVARYAESSGGGRSLLFPNAWRYRDYVIHSFNSDKPFNRFILEQIAGDLLEAKNDEERTWNLLALAYLMLGPINYEMQDKPVLESDVIDEQLDALGRGFLGMTIGCARCHDHKFDPIPQSDYYAMAGILRNTQSLLHDNVSSWVKNPLPVSGTLQAVLQKHEVQVAALKARIKSVRIDLKKAGINLAAAGILKVKDLPGIVIDDAQAKKVGKWSKSTFQNTFIGDGYLYSGSGQQLNTITFNPTIPRDGYYEVRLAYLPYTNRSANTYVRILHTDGETDLRIDQRKIPPIEGRWLSLGKYRFEKGDQWFVLISTKDANGAVVADAVQFLHEDDLNREAKTAPKASQISGKDLKATLQKLEADLKKLQDSAPQQPVAMGVREPKKFEDFFICIRGNIHNRGPIVPRGFLQVASYGKIPTMPRDQSGRLQLAQWIASDRNPLTARVMVNRIWLHLFGKGIVLTPDNFGRTGSPPSHPELLDYLAVRFIEEGWSVKKLIREIMLSHTYQLSSQVTENDANVKKALNEDVENRLLWRQNRQRLEAEVLRDTMLVVAGQLVDKQGGPGYSGSKVSERDFRFTDRRRSIYTPIFRNHLLELFEVFDFPDPNLVKGTRSASTVAPQALYLMNSPFVMDIATKAADRILTQSGGDEQRLLSAYRATLGRPPTEREQLLAIRFLGERGNEPGQRQQAWSRFYQVLFSCIDFRYVN